MALPVLDASAAGSAGGAQPGSHYPPKGMALGHPAVLGCRRGRGAGLAQAEDIPGPQLRRAGAGLWRLGGGLANHAGLDSRLGRGSARLGGHCALGNREVYWLVGFHSEPLAPHGESLILESFK